MSSNPEITRNDNHLITSFIDGIILLFGRIGEVGVAVAIKHTKAFGQINAHQDIWWALDDDDDKRCDGFCNSVSRSSLWIVDFEASARLKCDTKIEY